MSKKKQINYLITILSILFLSSCSKNSEIKIDYNFESAINTEKGIHEFKDINFEPLSDLNLGFYKGKVWIKLNIYNNTNNFTSYIVVNNDFFNLNYRFYKLDTITNQLQTISKSKDNTKLDHRTYNYIKPNFEINLKPKEKGTFFIITHSDGRICQATPKLLRIEEFNSVINQTYLVNIFFIIAIGLILLINIFYWSLFKNRIYYFYSFYILSSFLFFLNVEGYFYGILTNEVIDHLVFISIRIWILSVSIFSSRFLELSSSNPTFNNIGKKLLIIILGGTTLYQILFFDTSISNLHIIENIFGFFWVIIAIIMIIISIKKIPIQAKYYLTAFSFLILFLIIGLINSHTALIPADPFTFLKIGMIIEFSGFTYFIALIIKKSLKKTSQLEVQLLNNQKELSEVSKELKLKTKSDLSNKSIDKTDILNIFKLLESTLSKENEWPEFKLKFEKLSPNFISNLKLEHPDLSKSEIRLLTLIRIGFSQKEIANLLNIEPNSVKKAKQRVRKKLCLSRSMVLKSYLSKFK